MPELFVNMMIYAGLLRKMGVKKVLLHRVEPKDLAI